MSVQLRTRKTCPCRFCLLPIIKKENATSSICREFAETCFGTFNIKVSSLKKDEVCSRCVRRLRDAKNFKELVRKSEERHLALVADDAIKGECKAETVERIEMENEEFLDPEIFDEEPDVLEPEVDTVFEPKVSISESPVKGETPSIQRLLSRPGLQIKRLGLRNKINKLSVAKDKTKKTNQPPSDGPLAWSNKNYNKIILKIADGAIKDRKKVKKLKKVRVIKVNLEKRSERRMVRGELSILLKNTTAMPFLYGCSAFRCFFCLEIFPLFDQLYTHMTELHTDPAKLKRVPSISDLYHIEITDLKCRKCLKPFPDVLTAVEHLNKKHDLDMNPNCSDSIVQVKLINEQGYNCHLCSQKYYTFRNLSVHMNEHFPNYMCDVCGKPFLSEKRHENHMLSHTTGDFKCPHCDLSFTARNALTNHKAKHRETKFSCIHCGMKFKSYEERVLHLTEAHNVIHKMVCPFPNCNKEFTDFPVFKRHKLSHRIPASDSQQRKHACEVCEMKFKTPRDLRRHSAKHAAERPHKTYYNRKALRNSNEHVCTECGMTFAQKSNLEEHKKMHPEVEWAT